MSLFIMTSWPLFKYKTSNGVALYNFQGNKVVPLLPWTIVALRNTMAMANRIACTKSRDR